MTSKKLIEEEINNFVNEIPTNKLGETLMKLTESLKVIDLLNQASESFYDKDNQITPENWEYFKNSLIALTDSEDFQKQCKIVNCKLYCVKYFAKINLSTVDFAEDTIKFELKKYFKQLVTNDADKFIEAFFSLPFEFVSLVVRWLANVACKEKKNLLTPKLATAQAFYTQTEELKNKFTKNINDLSLGTNNNFSLEDLALLLDSKAFFEYSPLNVGTIEFIIRLFDKRKQALEDELGSAKYNLLRTQALLLPSYVKFLNEIDMETELPYFNSSGLQSQEREKTFADFVTEVFTPQEYIPEPAKTPAPQAAPPVPAVAAEQPSEEELKTNEAPEPTA